MVLYLHNETLYLLVQAQKKLLKLVRGQKRRKLLTVLEVKSVRAMLKEIKNEMGKEPYRSWKEGRV